MRSLNQPEIFSFKIPITEIESRDAERKLDIKIGEGWIWE